MVIHFPTALLPADLVLSYLYLVKNDSSYGQAAFYCLVGGVALGALALITGIVDLLLIPKENKQALAAGLIHGFINGIIIIAYMVIAFKEWKTYSAMAVPSNGSLAIKTILVLTLFIGNYLGGRLIYKYKVGTE
jgi:uncharacterized membrane protein